MNHFLFFAVTFSFVFTIVIAQSNDELPESNDNSESIIDPAVNTVEEIYSTANEMTKAQEEALTEALGDMITYFTKSITDMSNIYEDIKSVSVDNTDSIRNNLVDNLMNYVENTEMMKKQMGNVMVLRDQFQNSILKQLYSMPISEEDARKLESDIREQIKLRADQLPNIQHIMNFPQRVSKFIPNL